MGITKAKKMWIFENDDKGKGKGKKKRKKR